MLLKTMDPGLKIAGVTDLRKPHPNPLPGRVRVRTGVVSRRGLPPPSCLSAFIRHLCFCFFFGFKYCGPLIEAFRGDEKKVIEPFRNDGQGDGGGVQG